MPRKPLKRTLKSERIRARSRMFGSTQLSANHLARLPMSKFLYMRRFCRCSSVLVLILLPEHVMKQLARKPVKDSTKRKYNLCETVIQTSYISSFLTRSDCVGGQSGSKFIRKLSEFVYFHRVSHRYQNFKLFDS